MKTAIVTDTNSGITGAEAEEMLIHLMPMPVIIDGEVFYEGETIDQKTFFEAQVGGRDVTSSQPSPAVVEKLWEDTLKEGYDDLVYIPMSSGLSGSCQTAKMLADKDRFRDKVFVADNHRISVTMRQSVERALILRERGMDGRAICEQLEKEAFDQTIYIAVDTLEYLKKGGRVTAAGAAIGSVLNIKPILTIQGEKLDAFRKCRGSAKAKSILLEALDADIKARFSRGPLEELDIYLAGSMTTQEEIAAWTTYVQEHFPKNNIIYNPLSLSICCHIGPGSFAAGVCPNPNWD
ncbi:MAG: DegV family protein [Lachnospiraceae bacterium]|nr:DegV family protein [Lachnospiraceae bacterium]